MKKIFVSILAIIVISSSVAAQDTTKTTKQNVGTPHPKAKKHREEARKELNLTETQKKALIANRLEARSKTTAIENDKNLTEAQKREKLEALHKEQKEKKDALLSTEQKAKLEQAKVKHRQEEKEQAEKRRAMMKEKLSLTDEQDAKLNELAKANEAKMKAIRENPSLDAEAKKKQMQELREHAAEERKAILTPEQQKKLEEMKKEHKEKML